MHMITVNSNSFIERCIVWSICFDTSCNVIILVILLFRLQNTKNIGKYRKILRNKVARHPDHSKALSDNLGVDSGRFIAKNPNNMEDAAAELLIHWANRNEGEMPIWGNLLK